METLIIVFHMLTALSMIGLILIQQGKGADMGASFGAGASQTLFGSRGSGNALTRTTAILTAIFFGTSLALTVIAKDQAEHAGQIGLPVAPATASQQPAQKAAPAPAKSVDAVPPVEHNSAPANGEVPPVPTPPKQ